MIREIITMTEVHFTQVYDDDGPGITPWELLTLMAQMELRIKASGGDLSRRVVVVSHRELQCRTFFRMSAPLLKERQADGR